MIIKDARYDVNLFPNISPTNGSNMVLKAAPETKPAKTSQEALATRTDTVQISSHPASSGVTLQKVKEKIIREISRGTPPEKLRELKSRIASGGYTIDAGELARILSE